MKKIYNLVLVLFCILAAGAFTGFSSDAKTVHKSFVAKNISAFPKIRKLPTAKFLSKPTGPPIPFL